MYAILVLRHSGAGAHTIASSLPPLATEVDHRLLRLYRRHFIALSLRELVSLLPLPDLFSLILLLLLLLFLFFCCVPLCASFFLL